MKRLFILFILLFSVLINQKSQVFKLGSMDLNLGIGTTYNLYKGGFITGILPLSASLDYGFNDLLGPGVIGIGGIIGYTSFKTKINIFTTESGYKYTAMFFGIRGNYHLELIKNLDTYGGISMYYIHLKTDPYGPFISEYPSSLKSKIFPSIVLGNKYFFNDKIALFVELGLNVSALKIGVTFRI